MRGQRVTLQEKVAAWLAEQELDTYLVGGSVRDSLLGRTVYDLDVAVDGDALSLARKLADHFRGDFYPLDDLRRTGRAILYQPETTPLVVDLAQFRGPDLVADLADRDFTINAMAVNVRSPLSIIDRHNGFADLRKGLIRPVTSDSIRNDPLRALRAVRLAAQLQFDLTEETVAAIRRDGRDLVGVSGERICDELARLLVQPSAFPFLEMLQDLGLLFLILPELEPLHGLTQPRPHHLDVFRHSLRTVGMLENLLGKLTSERDRGQGVAVPALQGLERYGDRIKAHLAVPQSGGRPRLVTLKLAALLHDVGKPRALAIDAEGRTRFIGHENVGSQIAAAALRRLRFSGAEVSLVDTVIRNHMRPLLLADQAEVSRRAVYRFFRATGDAGVDVILHALADHLAIHAPGTGERRWSRLLSLAVRMLGDYWEFRAERVNPPRLINGHDLRSEFGLQPGPRIGGLLEAVREAQAADQIRTRDEAMALVRYLLSAGQGSDQQ